MELRRIDNYTYDVFCGTTWNEWSRVRQFKQGTKVIRGARLERSIIDHLDSVLHPSMPITPGQSLEDMLFNNNAILTR